DRCPQFVDAAIESRDVGLVGEIGHGYELDALMRAQRETLGFRRDDVRDVTGGTSLDEGAGHRISERARAAGNDHMTIAKIHGSCSCGFISSASLLRIRAS